MRKIIILQLIFISYQLSAQIKVEVLPKIHNKNGQIEIPKGLFGVHTGGFTGFTNDLALDWGIESSRNINQSPSGTPYEPFSNLSFLVECWWDRFNPPLQVRYPTSWKQTLTSLGHIYATAPNPNNYQRVLEFWNEPYLNWAYKPAVAYDPQWYDETTMVENGSVKRKNSSEIEPYLIWKKGNWYKPLDKSWAADPLNIYNRISQGWNLKMSQEGCPYPCLNIFKPGDTIYPGTTNRILVIERLIPTDTSQISFYSARQNYKYYSDMYAVLADTIRKLNPEVMLIAGWGFEFFKDNWNPWHQLLKPLIDAQIKNIDGIHEHHYGMDTRIITAQYETVAAYANTKYGKKLKFLNTETGGFIDPQRPESISNSAGSVSEAQKALNAYTYNTKDILYMITNAPDKAFSRAVHEPQLTNGGVEKAFKLLRSLRGEMLFSTSNHKDIWQVASLDGNTMTIACFNGDTLPRAVQFSVNAPLGTQFVKATEISADTNTTSELVLYENEIPINATTWENTFQIKAYSPIVVKFELSNVPTIADTVVTSQFYADTILVDIPQNNQFQTSIAVPANIIASCKSARLKLVLMNYQSNGSITFNGKQYSLSNYAGGNASEQNGGITYINIDSATLALNNTITISSGDKSVILWMISIETNTEKIPEDVTNTNTLQIDHQLTISPNPTNGKILITGDIESGTLFSLFSIDGKMVMQQRVENATQCLEQNLTSISNGIYFLKSNHQQKSYKIIIAK